jgi:phosphoesterase RecJ-like protein
MHIFNPSDIKTLSSELEKAEKVAIVTHFKPDGDAMGSSLAMHCFIKHFFKCEVKIILNDRYPQSIAFMVDPEAGQDILTYDENPDEIIQTIAAADHIVALDFNAFHRTDRLETLLKESEAFKILIDHHLHPDTESFNLVFSYQSISSASELVYHILKATPQCQGKKESIPFHAAESLMTGMTTDTNNFANSTFPSTLQMASELIEIGVDRDKIIFNLYNQYGENRIRLLGYALKDLLKITDDGVAYIVIDKDTLERYNIQEGDTEGFVNMPLAIAKVRMSILVKEDDGRLRVSIRSKKGTSANRCSKLHFNGGGHENAAGGRLNVPEDVKSISEVGEYIEKHTHIFITSENEA